MSSTDAHGSETAEINPAATRTTTSRLLDALHSATAQGIQLPDSVLTTSLTERIAQKTRAEHPQSGENLVAEVIRHTEQGTIEARAPQPYRHDEWRPAGENFKSIPETKQQREEIRAKAAEVAAGLSRNRPPGKKALFTAAEELLKPLGWEV